MFEVMKYSKGPVDYRIIIDEIIQRSKDDGKLYLFYDLSIDERVLLANIYIEQENCLGDILSDMHDSEAIYSIINLIRESGYQRDVSPPLPDDECDSIILGDIIDTWNDSVFKIISAKINEIIYDCHSKGGFLHDK